MSSPLRIAIVSREYPPFYGGGIGSYARWIVPALTAAGVRVHVITEAHDRVCARVEVDGLVTVHRVPLAIGRGGWTSAAARFSINAGRCAARLWRTGKIDLVEFAECEAAGGAMLLTRHGAGRPPTVVQLHTPSEQLFVLRSLTARALDASLETYFLAERLALRLADGVLAPSRFIADWAEEHYGLPVAPSVIPYATGPLPAAPPPAAGEGLTVLYIGRIEPRKGVESLFRAWGKVARAHPDATLVLAGADTSGAPDGGSMRAYLTEVLDPGARDRVRFLGRLEPGVLQGEYARADLCVIPSLWENFPNTCIESMSNARAVLVGDAGGMREMIGASGAGETFRAGDADDLAARLGSMLAEGRGGLADRGRAARARIETMCDPARIAALRIVHARGVIGQRAQTLGKGPGGAAGQQSGVLGEWRRLERVAMGDISGFPLPRLDDGVREWVERSGVGA